MKRLVIATAVTRSTTVLNATTPPNADCGSDDNAFLNASSAVPAMAMPQGVVCLMIAQAGTLCHNEAVHIAASRSRMLLKESSLPWRCFRSRRPRGSSST